MPISRIAIGTREEATQSGALKAALAEFFATAIFVFAGQGSGVAFSKLTGDGPTTPAGLVAAAVGHAFALFVAVSISANISGGHVNPAVTFGLFLGGNITLFRGILYWIAQLLGAVVACLLLRFTTGLATGTFGLTGIGFWNGLVLEIVLTFGLVYTVYATAVDPKKGHIGTIAPLAIGFIVGANILVGGAFDGASMNNDQVMLSQNLTEQVGLNILRTMGLLKRYQAILRLTSNHHHLDLPVKLLHLVSGAMRASSVVRSMHFRHTMMIIALNWNLLNHHGC